MRLSFVAILLVPLSLGAQHPGMPMGHMPASMPESVSTPTFPMDRLSSGTSWAPAASPSTSVHKQVENWMLMLDGQAFLEYDHQSSTRGSDQLGSINWGMLMASRPLAQGTLSLATMLSAEPWTVTPKGYPLLLQSGESYQGVPLHDRQHPHDLVMELSARYDHPLSHRLAAFAYLAPVGEPALGPPAFPHRASASSDPFAPIGHHWQDATHITFGVVTAGLYTQTFQIETSLFNGREPDENRTNIDRPHLDSYATRLTWNPTPRLSLSSSYGYLKSPEALPTDPMRRLTVSLMHTLPLSKGSWTSTLVYGQNTMQKITSPSILAETNFNSKKHTFFARAELVDKSSEDLSVPFNAHVGELSLGYAHDLSNTLSVGAMATLNYLPASLGPTYGTRIPVGTVLFLRLHPPRHTSSSMSPMPAMPMKMPMTSAGAP